MILSDFKSATILQACMRLATLMNFLCGVYVQCIGGQYAISHLDWLYLIMGVEMG